QANPLKLNSSQLSTTSHSKFSEIFANLPTEQSFPRELDLTLALSKSKEGLTLFYSHPVKRGEKISSSNNFLTPFPILPFDFQHEKLFLDKKGNLYGKMEIDWDGEYQEPEVPLPANGKFKKPYTLKFLYQPPGMEQAQVISKTFSQFDLNTSEQMTSFFSLVRPVPPPKAKSKTALPADDPNGHENLSNQAEENSSNSTSSLLFYLLLAFIGGFILNFMPCVLPVISLKLFSLINSRDKSKRTILKHNLFYTLGILSSFLILAIVIATLKSSGVSVGWGMQLQSPHFNIVMIIILFIFALNLFSLFEFNTPGGSKLGSISTGEGGLADFFNGVLATVLSTPCSAPFLGTALTFALLAPAHIIILVFLAIGFGLAAPFILTAFFPALITFLPKPGLWMEHLKRFLGLSILLTIVWLFNILSNQVDDRFLIPLLLMTLLFIFFSLYMQKQLKSSPLFKTIMAIVPIPMLIYLTIFIKSTSLVSDVTPSPTVTSAQNSEGLTWIPWSPAKMEELQKSGTPTFIDFTAKWCFTCKVNEKLVIHTDDFTQLAKKYQLKLLLADWTKRDPIIGDWLLAHGYAGVPAYFVINNQGKIIPLGETISISEIEEALK
ncbi:MAG: hypothetical protein HN730_00095, partial [Bdellovibrionales bacterium]|nr:hypothetical protein [Bdellovibrionales bacterium]